jgi:hypothetical protein
MVNSAVHEQVKCELEAADAERCREVEEGEGDGVTVIDVDDVNVLRGIASARPLPLGVARLPLEQLGSGDDLGESRSCEALVGSWHFCRLSRTQSFASTIMIIVVPLPKPQDSGQLLLCLKYSL